VALRINTVPRIIVAMCRVFSAPRFSNLPKSFDPGAIERPFHFACTRIRITRRILTTIWIMKNILSIERRVKILFFG